MSKLDFGSYEWENSERKIMRKLDTIHNAGLRMAIEAYRSRLISSIFNLAGIPPIEVKKTTDRPQTRGKTTIAIKSKFLSHLENDKFKRL